MIISDERFAAALVTSTGDALKFDDIGCLVEHEAGQLRPDVAYWVRDSQSGAWLNAREAIFVHSPSVVSPMGYGLAARPADQAADEPAAGPDRRILRFHELEERIR
jgi:copper chaperone NosL